MSSGDLVLLKNGFWNYQVNLSWKIYTKYKELFSTNDLLSQEIIKLNTQLKKTLENMGDNIWKILATLKRMSVFRLSIDI